MGSKTRDEIMSRIEELMARILRKKTALYVGLFRLKGMKPHLRWKAFIFEGQASMPEYGRTPEEALERLLGRLEAGKKKARKQPPQNVVLPQLPLQGNRGL